MTAQQHTETFISETAIKTKFRIEQAYKPDFGMFLITRYLYSITATGGNVWFRLLFFLLFTFALSPLALAADLTAAAVYALLVLTKKIIEGLWLAAVNILQAAVSKLLGTILTFAATVAALLTLYYKWDYITDFFKNILTYKYF
ncbi:MAG: hypothetical protein J6T70_04115 [Bacteroidales bacterium]|nr:hypothetical protein [Bacteroidales bacterium]